MKMTREEFDRKYLCDNTRKIAVCTRTTEEARDFLRMTHEAGYTWSTGDDITKSSMMWEVYKNETVYSVDKYGISYGKYDWAVFAEYSFVEFSDTVKPEEATEEVSTISDLQSDDILITAQGLIYTYFKPLEMMYLTDKDGKATKVCMPIRNVCGDDLDGCPYCYTIDGVKRNGEVVFDRSKSKKIARIKTIEEQIEALKKELEELKK